MSSAWHKASCHSMNGSHNHSYSYLGKIRMYYYLLFNFLLYNITNSPFMLVQGNEVRSHRLNQI